MDDHPGQFQGELADLVQNLLAVTLLLFFWLVGAALSEGGGEGSLLLWLLLLLLWLRWLLVGDFSLFGRLGWVWVLGPCSSLFTTEDTGPVGLEIA